MKKISSTNCFLGGGGMCSVIVEHNFYFTALHFFHANLQWHTWGNIWKPVEDLIVQSNSNTNKEFKYIY